MSDSVKKNYYCELVSVIVAKKENDRNSKLGLVTKTQGVRFRKQTQHNQPEQSVIRMLGKNLDKKSSRTLILIISTFSYLLLGAAVFDKLESEADFELRDELAHIRNHLQRKYNFTEKDLEILQTIVIKSIPYKAGYQWKFAGAFYFATVVITTVGYGHSAPETTCGKLFCMVFALAGIPLGLIMFQSIGERVNTGIACCLHRIRQFLHQIGIITLRQITPTHLLVISLSIGTLIIIIGTYVFHRAERWTIFEAYYYCVITLTTIGFGDYVPLQREGILQKDLGYVVFTLLFVLLGLAVFSACVNLLVLGFMAPNADVVTAASREPPRSIVFEQLDPYRPTTNDSRDWKVFRKYSSHNQVYRNSTELRNAVLSTHPNAKPRLKFLHGLRAFCAICCSRRTPRRPPFTVRRMSTQNIEHLVNSYIGPNSNVVQE